MNNQRQNMSNYNYSHIFNAASLTLIASLLASCGGGGSGGTDSNSTAQSADAPNVTAQAVSGSASVPKAWAGRAPVLNTSGAIPIGNAQIIGADPTKPISTQAGIIESQFWIYERDRQKIDAILKTKRYITLIAWRDSIGYLVGFDPANQNSIKELNEIKATLGEENVFERFYIGSEADLSFYSPPGADNLKDLGSNWHLEHIKAPAAWDYFIGGPEKAAPVSVGVMDLGIYDKHPEIKAAITKNLTNTLSWHGTAVVGTIAGAWGNSDGLVGVSPTTNITFGAYTSESVDYDAVASSGVKIINNSWGPCGANAIRCPGDGEAIQLTRKYRVFAKTYNKILHVWAAGNDTLDASRSNGALNRENGDLKPLDNIIVVGALTSDGNLADTSNYGKYIDIVAPTSFAAPATYNDTSKVATYMRGNYGSDYSCDRNQVGEIKSFETCAFYGTSAAAPVVTGVAALMLSYNPKLTAGEIKKILIESATTTVKKRNIKGGSPVLLLYPIRILNAANAVAMVVKNMKPQTWEKTSISKKTVKKSEISSVRIVGIVLLDKLISLVGINNAEAQVSSGLLLEINTEFTVRIEGTGFKGTEAVEIEGASCDLSTIKHGIGYFTVDCMSGSVAGPEFLIRAYDTLDKIVLPFPIDDYRLISFINPILAPNAPSLSDLGSGIVRVSWVAVFGASGYQISRDGTDIATLGATTAYDDAGRPYGMQACYRVRTLANSMMSVYSPQQCITPAAPTQCPNSWSGGYTPVGGSESTNQSCPSGQTGSITLSHYCGSGGVWGSISTSNNCIAGFSPPTGLAASIYRQGAVKGIRLTWNTVPTADSYLIYRYDNRANPFLAAIGAVTHFEDTLYSGQGLISGNSYCYRIAAQKGSTTSSLTDYTCANAP